MPATRMVRPSRFARATSAISSASLAGVASCCGLALILPDQLVHVVVMGRIITEFGRVGKVQVWLAIRLGYNR